MKGHIGLDVGAVSTNLVFLGSDEKIVKKIYLRTSGDPIKSVKTALGILRDDIKDIEVLGIGTTGSGRYLAAALAGADEIKNEITSHGVAAISINPDIRTIFEIGGQDSKMIIMKDGVVTDFSMNNICAAGTGAFLDQQSVRLQVPIEEFGAIALKSKEQVKIAGRCTVFAESDMIHKQQLGYTREDIIAGLCDSLVRNYLTNVGKGHDIEEPIFFQGGVAANAGIKDAFEKYLKKKIFVPQYFDVMGALGVALVTKRKASAKQKTVFRGFGIIDRHFVSRSFNCQQCPTECEVLKLLENNETIAYWGDICGKWSSNQ